MKKYLVLDTQTANRMGVYSTMKAALRKADKLDLEYGAIRYQVVPVPVIPKQQE